MTRSLAWVGALAVIAMCGCSGTTSGTGQAESPTGSPSTPDFPSPTSTTSTAGLPSSSSPVSSSAASTPTLRQRADRLTTQTDGEAHDVVAVPGGAEAATYDRVGNIQFWRSTGAGVDWTRIGASHYPAEVDGQPYHVTVHGARLSGMSHATFIVSGQFTNDNSGHAVAYTAGAHGWGAIKAEANGNIGSSGRPVGADRIGLSYDFGFVGGMLKTEDCPPDEPIANCGSDHIDKLWTWTGRDFARS